MSEALHFGGDVFQIPNVDDDGDDDDDNDDNDKNGENDDDVTF